jgi:4-hydroxybenzoate polyprenyltransferase
VLPVIDFLRLIRFPNLLIMAFTQYMVRWFLVKPMLEVKSAPDFPLALQMNNLDFFLLSLSTVMLAAAGYIINDYFDVRIDKVNRPNSNVVGRTIKRRVAMGAHTVINVIACALGIWLSYKYGLLRVGIMLYVTVPALLWFYSTNLKRQFLIGNAVIAILSGLVPLIVVLFEVPLLNRAYFDYVTGYNELGEHLLSFIDIVRLTAIFSAFAFVVSLLREIIKDTEDYEGDLEYGCRTLPIVLGISRAKGVIAGVTIATMGMLGYLQYLQSKAHEWNSFLYFLVLLQLPLAYLMFRVMRARDKKDFHFASLFTKLIMLSGICYLFLFAYLLRHSIA